MAYFCEKSGARIVAPGVAVSAGGTIPDYAGLASHIEAEAAAAAELQRLRSSATEIAPSAAAIASASSAALKTLDILDAPAKGDKPKPAAPASKP